MVQESGEVHSRKLLYVQTSGLENPERVYAPFILAIDAAAAGIHATVYFFLRGVLLLLKGESERIHLEGYPPLSELIAQAVRSGVVLEACEQSCMLLGVNKQDLIEQTKIVGASTLNDRMLTADGVLSF
jgi:predicted peroxiredoxin